DGEINVLSCFVIFWACPAGGVVMVCIGYTCVKISPFLSCISPAGRVISASPRSAQWERSLCHYAQHPKGMTEYAAFKHLCAAAGFSCLPLTLLHHCAFRVIRNLCIHCMEIFVLARAAKMLRSVSKD